MKKDYKVLESEIEYENTYFRVRRDRVILPNGREKDYFILDKGEAFSVAIPLTDAQKTYLVGQYRPASKFYSWEFPMGYVKGESPLEMAKTELREETGLTAQKWKEIGKFHLSPGHTGQLGYVFVAKELTEDKPEFEESEFLDIKADIEVQEVGRMIMEGKITDGPTIIAYHFLEQYLKT